MQSHSRAGCLCLENTSAIGLATRLERRSPVRILVDNDIGHTGMSRWSLLGNGLKLTVANIPVSVHGKIAATGTPRVAACHVW